MKSPLNQEAKFRLPIAEAVTALPYLLIIAIVALAANWYFGTQDEIEDLQEASEDAQDRRERYNGRVPDGSGRMAPDQSAYFDRRIAQERKLLFAAQSGVFVTVLAGVWFLGTRSSGNKKTAKA